MLCNENYSNNSCNCNWIIVIAAIVVVWLLCGNNLSLGNNNCGCGC